MLYYKGITLIYVNWSITCAVYLQPFSRSFYICWYDHHYIMDKTIYICQSHETSPMTGMKHLHDKEHRILGQTPWQPMSRWFHGQVFQTFDIMMFIQKWRRIFWQVKHGNVLSPQADSYISWIKVSTFPKFCVFILAEIFPQRLLTWS